MFPKNWKLIDFYRRVPQDLTEATGHGAVLSLCAGFFMTILFLVELYAFMSANIETSIILDSDVSEQLRINFNISMLDLPCEYASVDVLDVLGTNKQNVTKNVDKWALDSSGAKRIFHGRNREQNDISHELLHETLEDLHANGVHAVVLNSDNYDAFISENKNVFINFYAPWCVWCQRLAPVWEYFAETVDKHKEWELKIGRVDCVAERAVCIKHQIRAFPTLRLFRNGRPVAGDYREDRTVDKILAFAKDRLDLHDELDHSGTTAARKQELQGALDKHKKDDHPGCLISGSLQVNRVPGNFHIEASSKSHNLNPTATNLTHIVHHLSFGEPLTRRARRRIASLPDELKMVSPMDGKLFKIRKMHQAHHHYIKVVGTKYEIFGKLITIVPSRKFEAYQMVAQDQIMEYESDDVPEARFSYDISPMGVTVKKNSRKWYDFVTSICAVIGGTFTVVGIVDALLHSVFKQKSI